MFSVLCLRAWLTLLAVLRLSLLVLVVCLLIHCSVIHLLPVLEWLLTVILCLMFGTVHCDETLLYEYHTLRVMRMNRVCGIFWPWLSLALRCFLLLSLFTLFSSG